MDFWTHHIPDEVLTDYAAGHAAALSLRAHVRSHTQECRRCGKQLATLEKMLAAMRADHSRDAAPEMLAWASHVFRTRPRAQSAPASLAKKIQAVLRIELSPFAPALGERSAPGPERQFLYQAGEYELDLRFAAQGGQWLISGQILGPVTTGTVYLSSRTLSLSVPLNELAEFTLPPVPDGFYTLRAIGPELHIEVTDLQPGL